MRAYIIILALVLLSSCSPRIIQTVRTEKDSVYVTEIITLRDTAVLVEQDSSLVRALIECDSLGRARIREILELQNGKHIKPPGLTLKDNILTATAQVDSFAIFVKYRERYKQMYRSYILQESEVTIEEVNRLHWWQKSLIWSGVISIVIFSIKIYKKVKK